MDEALDVGLGQSEAEVRALLEEIREAHSLHIGRRADCAASLAMNEIVALLVLEEWREAEEALDRYRTLYERHVSAEELADFHSNRGWLLARLGRTQASTEEYITAAALAYDLPPYKGAAALLYAALTYVELQDIPRADRYLRLADSLAQANLDSTLVPETLGEIRIEQALALQRGIEAGTREEAEYADVRRLAEEALSFLDDSAFQGPDRAMSHLVAARAALRLGQREEARSWLARAAPLVADSYASYVVVEEAILRGEVAEAEGDVDAARSAYSRAVEAAQEELLMGRALDALLALGAVEEAAGADDLAAERYEEAIELGEAIRQRQGLQDWSLSASEQTALPYGRLSALLARQGDSDRAFQMLDASRARRLLDLRASLQARIRLGTDERLRADSLLDALDGVRLALPRASGVDRASLEAEATRLQRLLTQTTGLELDPPPPLDLEALTDTLSSRNQLLISYLLDEEASWAFVVGPNGVDARQLDASQGEIRGTIQRISKMWSDGDAQTLDAEFELAALEQLYGMLVAPLLDAIPEGAGIVTVPPADLATIPFGMLVEPGGPTDDYATARYLIRERPVSTELAAALLVAPSEDKTGVDHLVFGRSEFEDRADLPFVRDETKRVRRALPSPLLRLDEEATEAALTSHLGNASLVHLASHATADPEFPLYSQILLADDPEAGDDGTLHLYELESQPLAADLVVLSGCSTARGRTLRGEGMIGLQYGVRAAGARSAVATLWPVDDRATVEIMGRFYEALADGLPKDRALQTAQVAYLERADRRVASPFYWAPAVLSGDVSPVPWEAPSRLGYWLLLLVGLMAASTVAWRLTQRLRRV